MDYINDDLLSLTHSGDDYDKFLGAVVPPVFLNSLHVFDTYEQYADTDPTVKRGYFYGRVSNPTVEILEKKLAELERGQRAAVFASGMAAATAAIYSTCQSGDHIVSLSRVYGPVVSFLDSVLTPKYGVDVSYVSGEDLNELEAAIRPNTKLLILESPLSLVFSVVDIKAIADIAKKHGVLTYIDNSYCTPLYQKPLELGIDIVMHTMSKYIGGHSDIIGGVVASKSKEIMDNIFRYRELGGAIIGPMEAWLAIRGLRTMAARVAVHQDTATKVAQYLEKHPKVYKVYYPGLASHPQRAIIEKQQSGSTGLMAFVLDMPAEKAVELTNTIELFGIGCSWGGHESLMLPVMYGASPEGLAAYHLTEKERGILRVHCGLEGADNLIAALEKGIAAL